MGWRNDTKHKDIDAGKEIGGMTKLMHLVCHFQVILTRLPSVPDKEDPIYGVITVLQQ